MSIRLGPETAAKAEAELVKNKGGKGGKDKAGKADGKGKWGKHGKEPK